jgi:hypothetical protein
LQGDRITAWQGANNLGADDKVYLIQDAGSERSLATHSRFNHMMTSTNGQHILYWSNWDASTGGSAFIKGSYQASNPSRHEFFSAYFSSDFKRKSQAYWNDQTSTDLTSGGVLSAVNPGVRIFDYEGEQSLGGVDMQPALQLDADSQDPLPFAWKAGERRADAPTFALLNDTDIDGNGVSAIDGITSDGRLNVLRPANQVLQISVDAGQTWSVFDPEEPLSPGEYELGDIRMRLSLNGSPVSAEYTNDTRIVVDVTAPSSFASATEATTALENQHVLYTADVTGSDTDVIYSLKSGLQDDAALLTIDPSTGQVRLAAGGYLDYDNGQQSYSFTVLATDRAGNVAATHSEIAVQVDLTNDTQDNQTVVLLDASSGKDYIGKTVASMAELVQSQAFDANKTYNLYIRLPSDIRLPEQGSDRSVGEFTGWTGFENLGSDDTIRVILKDAGEGLHGSKSVIDRLITYPSTPAKVVWSNQPAGTTATDPLHKLWFSNGRLFYQFPGTFQVTYPVFDGAVKFATDPGLNTVKVLPTITSPTTAYQFKHLVNGQLELI